MSVVRLPTGRGPMSACVLDILNGSDEQSYDRAPELRTDALLDGRSDDVQLALYLCYEVQYAGLPGTEHLEWDLKLIEIRQTLERAFLTTLDEEIARSSAGRRPEPTSPHAVSATIRHLLDADDGPSLSRYMETAGTLEQMRELIVHRSPYQLKEGDPHTAGVQRLNGRAKQILVQIQAGEYGADAPGRRTHAALFADTMCSLGLDPTPNAYLDVLPASSLAISNLISMFGFNRRWRGSLVGQLAAFEMTSVIPMGRYAAGLVRMGAPNRSGRFYDVHVMADAEHEVMAIEMVEQQCTLEPTTADDVVFGVQSTMVVERWFAETLLHSWRLIPSERAAQPMVESWRSTDALMARSAASGGAPRPAHRMQSSHATRGRPLRTQ